MKNGDADVFPLSWGQQGLWFIDQTGGAGTSYTMPAVYRVRGALDVERLRESVVAVMRRHEVLRTTIEEGTGEGRQVVHADGERLWAAPELCAVVEADGDTLAARIHEAVNRPFDLERGPLWRVCVIRAGADEAVLVVTMHHIVSDGWSVGVWLAEVATVYAARRAGTAPPLAALPIQYADYAVWQRETLAATHAEQLAYWRGQLAGIAQENGVPTDRPRPAARPSRGAEHRLQVAPAVVEALKRMGRSEQATLFMVLLAAFDVVVAAYSGREDVVVGAPVAGRGRAELEGLIGLFVNVLVLRGQVTGALTFRELVRQVRATTVDAYAHQDCPFEQIVAALQPERERNRPPVVQILVAFQNMPEQRLALADVEVTPEPVTIDTIRYDLELVLREEGGAVVGGVRYATDLFEAATVARLAAQYEALLTAVSERPDLRLAEIGLLHGAERREVLERWSVGPATAEQPGDVADAVAAQARTHPARIAVVSGAGAAVSYAALNARAGHVAQRLRRAGVGPETRVGVCAGRGVELVVALLGVLKAGGAFVPLDAAYPAARLRYMIADAQIALVLTDAATRGALPWLETYCPVLSLDTDAPDGAAPDDRARPGVTPRNLAYLIYTSGSTGLPKGVSIEHRGLTNAVRAQTQVFSLRGDSRVLQFASPSFDAFVAELCHTLWAGGCLQLMDSIESQAGDELWNTLSQTAITHVTLTPSVATTVPYSRLPTSLETLILAGEQCATELLQRWVRRIRVFNAYGPTEATICTSIETCARTDRRPSIGRPIANVRTYVVDEWLQPVPPGIAGELYVGGAGVARGYWGKPGLTASCFIPDPFGGTGERLYRTGDRVRWDATGRLEFLGRIDAQVKIRGYRVEPGEIEAHLLRVPGVRSAAVVAQEMADGSRQLVAYIVPAAPAAIDVAALKAALRDELPDWMIPHAVVPLAALPLTPNGKLDRAALPPVTGVPEASYVPPQTPTQELLCDMWATVLGIDRVGVHDDFFDLGGDSLTLLRLRSAIRIRTGRQLNLADLMGNPTVSALDAFLGALDYDFGADEHAAVPR